MSVTRGKQKKKKPWNKDKSVHKQSAVPFYPEEQWWEILGVRRISMFKRSECVLSWCSTLLEISILHVSKWFGLLFLDKEKRVVTSGKVLNSSQSNHDLIKPYSFWEDLKIKGKLTLKRTFTLSSNKTYKNILNVYAICYI